MNSRCVGGAKKRGRRRREVEGRGKEEGIARGEGSGLAKLRTRRAWARTRSSWQRKGIHDLRYEIYAEIG